MNNPSKLIMASIMQEVARYSDYTTMPSDSRNKGIPNYAIKRNRKVKGWQKKGKGKQ